MQIGESQVMSKLYLGIDSSTQGIKAEVIDIISGEIVGSFAINFGKDLPEYKSPDGYLLQDDPLVRHSDPMMWVDALELLFKRMQEAKFPNNEILGISGSGQQHGSVYLKAFPTFLNPEKSLAEQWKPYLSRKTAPIWMDKSTSEVCADLTKQFGEEIRLTTGSPAIERFTGPQIAKFAKEDPQAWQNTNCVHLVSSFLCSVLAGASMPLDYGDGAGMNLLDLHQLTWHQRLVAATAPSLWQKLPKVVPSTQIVGKLHPYFEKYGFKSGIPLVVWSGDNPNSLIGVGCGTPGTAVISLGTSDTFFAAMQDFITDPEGYGHVFGNPQGGFMSLICFTNGSLAREKVKELVDVDWHYFDVTACESTEPGNHGMLMLPYFEPENTPLVRESGVVYNQQAEKPLAAEHIRCILESQALTMKLHSAWQGQNFKRIRVTGGASKSAAILRIFADVFQAKIETIAVRNSAGLGAAIRAANAIEGISFESLYEQFCTTVNEVTPRPEFANVYDQMLKDYKALEKSALSK